MYIQTTTHIPTQHRNEIEMKQKELTENRTKRMRTFKRTQKCNKSCTFHEKYTISGEHKKGVRRRRT